MNPTDACPVFRSGRRMLTKDRKGSWGAQGFPKDPRRFFQSKTTFDLDWKLPIGPPQLKLVTRCYQPFFTKVSPVPAISAHSPTGPTPEAFCISLRWNLRDHQGGDAHHWLHHTGPRKGTASSFVLGMFIEMKFRYV